MCMRTSAGQFPEPDESSAGWASFGYGSKPMHDPMGRWKWTLGPLRSFFGGKKNRTGSCSIGGLMTHLFFQNQELLVFRSWERLQASVPPKIIRASVRMIAQEPHVQCHAALATRYQCGSPQPPNLLGIIFSIRRAQFFREVNQLWSHLPRAVSSGFWATRLEKKTTQPRKTASALQELKMGRRCHGVSQIVK